MHCAKRNSSADLVLGALDIEMQLEPVRGARRAAD
jgi:hypothetical protein